ncbi:MAG: 3'(2'),5'-bisphosphate nucleotidase CysQ [Acidimicrobiales bacterium]|nr:3'(2'),5'-bisphosphate nucleotidase CysQ [Acidimicrobiales bacterium]
MDDHELAGWLAHRALVELIAHRDEGHRRGTALWRIEEDGDRLAHELLVAELAAARPLDAVLSEEGHDDRSRLEADRVWIVDPLDGSSDFAYRGSTEWAVHVALVDHGAPIAAAVAVPHDCRVYGTEHLPVPVRPAPNDPPVVVAGRSWGAVSRHVAQSLGARLTTCGSAGVKAMLVVSGAADVYVHASGLYEWDACAPAAVAAAAGLHVSGADGRPLVYNQSRPTVAGLVVCRPELADAVLDVLDGLG